jgi:Type I phosphodiesterase / nucleotide pyrophosphatase
VSERYEDVRRKLIERGYLHGRIERFLLRDAIAEHRASSLTRTSLKAALLGAPIVGGLLAASTVASNRPALSSRDALVLWLYFSILAGAALFLLDLAAAATAGAWARSRGARPADAMRAGLIVAVPVLVYLVAVWALRRSDRGLGSDVVFLVGATATAMLVAWLAGLVSLAGIIGRTGHVPDRSRRFGMIALAVLVPVGAVLFIVPTTSSSGERAQPPSDFTPAPTGERLVVVGVDGLDGGLVASSGDDVFENLLPLLARGAVYPTHRVPAEPPEVWTTLATGMPAEVHGVRQAGAKRLPGIAAPIVARSAPVALDAALRFLLPARTVPATGAGRRVRTLWEIAGLTRKAAAVSWWASWPAVGTEGDPQTGYVVSDRVLAKLLLAAPADRDTAPASLYARLAHDFPVERTRWRAEFDARFASLPDDARAVAWESFLIDAFAWRTTSKLLADPDLTAAFTYLPGLDILRARLSGRPAAADAVRLYVRWLDAAVFADLASEGRDRIVVIADPGRGAEPSAEGFVAVIGAGASPQCVGPAIGDLDVAPLVLRLAGLPASREMRGRAPDRCFEASAAPLPPIATWGRRGRAAAASGSEYDPEMVDRLKSLGYLR